MLTDDQTTSLPDSLLLRLGSGERPELEFVRLIAVQDRINLMLRNLEIIEMGSWPTERGPAC